MADEFVKGLGLFTGAGLAWMVLAGWYRTPSFESTQQLVAPVTVAPGSADLFNTLAISLMEVFFWLAVLGPLTFWVGIPAWHEVVVPAALWAWRAPGRAKQLVRRYAVRLKLGAD